MLQKTESWLYVLQLVDLKVNLPKDLNLNHPKGGLCGLGLFARIIIWCIIFHGESAGFDWNPWYWNQVSLAVYNQGLMNHDTPRFNVDN